MRIEVGKVYLDGFGNAIEIIRYGSDMGNYPYSALGGHRYNAEGRSSLAIGERSMYDLIAEAPPELWKSEKAQTEMNAGLSDADKAACYSAASARFAEAMEAPDATTETAELAAAETFIRVLTAKVVESLSLDQLAQIYCGAVDSARSKKSYADADRIRSLAAECGLVIETGRNGSTWRLAHDTKNPY